MTNDLKRSEQVSKEILEIDSQTAVDKLQVFRERYNDSWSQVEGLTLTSGEAIAILDLIENYEGIFEDLDKVFDND